MLGFRGASRYAHPAYADGFALECEALRRVRDEMGLTNLADHGAVLPPRGRGRAVLAAMARNGLKRGENGLEIYVMCEIPNNVIQIDAFAEVFDGFSIGSNDLTQLTLGVDRDSEIVAFDFDERDPGHAGDAAAGGQRAPSATAARSASAARRRPTIPRSRASSPSSASTRSASIPSSLLRTIQIVREAEAAN